MDQHFESIQDFAHRNLSWKVATFTKNDTQIGIVQGANSGRFRVVRLENGIVTDDLQVSNFERATNTFEGLVQEEIKVNV